MTRILINTAGDALRKNTGIYSLETVGDVLGGGTEKIEERMDVYEAIGRLEKHYRSVIILKYFEDMKLAEIAKHCKCRRVCVCVSDTGKTGT